jgi:hypothetical protein
VFLFTAVSRGISLCFYLRQYLEVLVVFLFTAVSRGISLCLYLLQYLEVLAYVSIYGSI